MLTSTEINNAIDTFKSANVLATVLYVQAKHFGFKDSIKCHKDALNKFNNYSFILQNYDGCSCVNIDDIVCEIENISNLYMENCANKLTREESLNLINLRITQELAPLMAAIGDCFDITGAGDTICEQISANATNISTNTSNISTNTTNIATNTSNISTNTTNISTNTTNIATNAADIAALEALDGREVVSSDDSIAVDNATSTEYDITISFDAGKATGEGEPGYLATWTNNGGSTPGEHIINVYKRYMIAGNISSYQSGVAAGAVAPNVYAMIDGPILLTGHFALTTFQVDWDLSSSNGGWSDWEKLATIPTTYTPPVGEGNAISLLPVTAEYHTIIFEATESGSLSTTCTYMGLMRVNTSGEVHIKLATPFTWNGTTVDEGFYNVSGTDYRAVLTGTIYINGFGWEWDR